MADGGEGTMQALVDATNGKIFTKSVRGPLNTSVTAHYGILGEQKLLSSKWLKQQVYNMLMTKLKIP